MTDPTEMEERVAKAIREAVSDDRGCRRAFPIGLVLLWEAMGRVEDGGDND